MKTCKILFSFFLLSVAANAQTVGDSLSLIEVLRPNGVVEKHHKGYTYEWYDDGSECDYVYYLDKNFVCTEMLISPFDPEVANRFLRSLDCDINATQISKSEWILKRAEGSHLKITFKRDYFTFYAFHIKPQTIK